MNQSIDETELGNSSIPEYILNMRNTTAVLFPVLYTFVLLIGVTGNVLVIYVIISNKHMRTCPNMLFLNLAVSDLLFLVFCVPLQAAFFVTKYQLKIGTHACKMLKYTTFVSTAVGAYSLAAICAFRCRAIVSPIQASRFLTTRHSMMTSLIIWLVMLAVNTPLAIYYRENGQCTTADDISDQSLALLLTVMLGADFLLPVLFVIGATAVIVRHFQAHSILSEHPSVTANGYNRKVIVVVIAVAAIFVVCWGPFNFLVLFATLGGKADRKVMPFVSLVTTFLAYSNSCLNPIIYNFASNEFRKSFRKTVKGAWCLRGLSNRKDGRMSRVTDRTGRDNGTTMQDFSSSRMSRRASERTTLSAEFAEKPCVP
ncbi:allatostatin-A receptor [Lingula anatina]|uniref:Allatostatin-A receptor n=1 Tax=Lingula anatina TaxID=7574 RepID=A0A1S3JIX3_LINAN|nr:allatostatin-A receptor [Lingula anatina]|eukprot:XP_013410323.1 allatostatin-A receptor [Lingula anatina]